MPDAWEYQAKRIDLNVEPEQLAATLDVLGVDGWELVAVVPVVGVHALAFLKRPRAAADS